MATLFSGLEAEDLLARPHADPNFRPALPSGSRKRGRSAENGLSDKVVSGKEKGCDIESLQRSLSARLGWEPMSQAVPFHSMDRALSYEVSALRAAAAAAVAEFTGTLEPSIQLTAPDKSEEIERAKSAVKRDQATGRVTSFRLQDGVGAGKSLGFSGPASVAADGAQASSDSRQSAYDVVYTQRGCPPHGAKAICGRRPRMEDAYTAVPFLLEVPVPGGGSAQAEIMPPRLAPQVKNISDGNSSDGEIKGDEPSIDEAERVKSSQQTSSSQAGNEETGSYLETLHFFGVFDGHGGAEAALHCAQTLHQHIAEALAAATEQEEEISTQQIQDGGDHLRRTSLQAQDVVSMPSGLPAVLRAVDDDDRADSSSEHLADQVYDDQAAETRSDGQICNSASFETALTSAFNRTDEEFGKADNAALVGTTAVVTLVGSRQLYVANCGDSRAVLCRAGVAIPLTDDHKAAREDETARVEAAGGQILFWNGIRVMGVLAVSRAIGDHCLRPYVIAQPEVTILARRPDDELLLLASDGLWDVLSNQDACTLAKRCLRRARQRGASRQSAARIAATVLTRAAVDRGSRDNVTVLVVDLSSGATDRADSLPRGQSAALAAEQLFEKPGGGESKDSPSAKRSDTSVSGVGLSN